MRFSLILLIVSLISSAAYATDSAADKEIVTSLQAGDPAPFSGTLLNPAAAARILADAESADARCKAEIGLQVGLTQAKMQYELDVLQARLDSCTFLSNSRLDLLRNQNEFLLDEMKRYQKPHHVWWFIGGTALGSAVVLGTVHAMSSAM